jgi:hypothetical protein
MKGQYVGAAFWKERKFEEIRDYCEEDVKCVLRICHTLSGAKEPLSFERSVKPTMAKT